MAENSITWKTAEDEGYKVSVSALNRKTVADGNLLFDNVLYPLSSRDQFIMDTADELQDKYNSAKATINGNKDTNWPNTLLTGYSAFNINGNTLSADARNTNLRFVNESLILSAKTNGNNIDFNMPALFNDSYRGFSLANGTNFDNWPDEFDYDYHVPAGVSELVYDNAQIRADCAAGLLKTGSYFYANIPAKYIYATTPLGWTGPEPYDLAPDEQRTSCDY